MGKGGFVWFGCMAQVSGGHGYEMTFHNPRSSSQPEVKYAAGIYCPLVPILTRPRVIGRRYRVVQLFFHVYSFPLIPMSTVLEEKPYGSFVHQLPLLGLLARRYGCIEHPDFIEYPSEAPSVTCQLCVLAVARFWVLPLWALSSLASLVIIIIGLASGEIELNDTNQPRTISPMILLYVVLQIAICLAPYAYSPKAS